MNADSLVNDFWNTEIKRGRGPSSLQRDYLLQGGGLTRHLIVQGAHSLLGLALPPTEGHVRGRHIPQMKQCQATLGEQLGNMDST